MHTKIHGDNGASSPNILARLGEPKGTQFQQNTNHELNHEIHP